MDEETKKIQPEIENLNLDEIDVEELEKRLELAVATTSAWLCGANCDQACVGKCQLSACGVNLPTGGGGGGSIPDTNLDPNIALQ
jgi:hypothetical protein